MSPSPNAGWQRYISAVRLLQVVCLNQLMFTSLATQELQFLKSGVEALFFWEIVCYSQNAQSRVNVCFLYFWFFTWMSDLHTLAHGLWCGNYLLPLSLTSLLNMPFWLHCSIAYTWKGTGCLGWLSSLRWVSIGKFLLIFTISISSLRNIGVLVPSGFPF